MRIAFKPAGGFLLGGLLTLLALELILRLVPVSSSTATAYHFDPEIITYPAHHEFVLSTGWDLRNAQKLRSNNLGFLASNDFVPNPDAVAVIGDSYVEANMLDEADRITAQLETRLGGRVAYALGGPGSSLLDYAERVRYAKSQLKINTFVLVIERGDVMETLCGSGNIHSPCIDATTHDIRHERQAPAGYAKKIIRQSALAQYLFSQLKVQPAKLLTQLFPSLSRKHENGTANSTTVEDVPMATTDIIVSNFIQKLPNQEGERYILVFDSERQDILLGTPIKAPVRQRFMTSARHAGLSVIDTEPLFREYAAHSHLRLEVGPYDHHWNSLANTIVAKAVAERLALPEH